MNKSILIVGATGIIGSHLIEKCLKIGFNITAISKSQNTLSYKLIRHIKCDISNKKELFKKLNRRHFDYIVNLAGYVDHSKKVKTIQTHFNGCKNLADFFKKKKIKKFIQIGSSVEYGKIKAPQTENKT